MSNISTPVWFIFNSDCVVNLRGNIFQLYPDDLSLVSLAVQSENLIKYIEKLNLKGPITFIGYSLCVKLKTRIRNILCQNQIYQPPQYKL